MCANCCPCCPLRTLAQVDTCDVDVTANESNHRNNARTLRRQLASWLDSYLLYSDTYETADTAAQALQQLDAAIAQLSGGPIEWQSISGLLSKPAWYKDEPWRLYALRAALAHLCDNNGRFVPTADIRGLFRQSATEHGGTIPATFFESNFKHWMCNRLPVWFFYDSMAAQPTSYFGIIPDSPAAAVAAASHLLLLGKQHGLSLHE
jgi:hypothetical protein